MKLMKALVALLVAAGLVVPAVAVANDNFTVNGSMRVEGFYNDYDDGDSETDDKTQWWEQRFRFNTVYKASDEVTARIQFDLEDYYGRDGLDTLDNAPNSSAIQTDVAYLQIDKEMWMLRGGQQAFTSPNAILADHTGAGLALTLKTPVSVKLQYTKVDEGGDSANGKGSKNDDGLNDDTDFYSAQLGYAAENFSLSAIYALLDDGAADTDKSAFGLAATFGLGNVDFAAELDFLDGDAGTKDYTGTQFYLNANTDLSDALNLGGWFMYIAGSDDANETVISDVTDDISFNPLWFGYVSSGIVGTFPISGAGPSSEVNNSGFVGGGLNLTYKASADLGFKAQFAYATEEEDGTIEGGYDMTHMLASAQYKVAGNTYFKVDAIFEDLDTDDVDEDSVSLWTQLSTSF